MNILAFLDRFKDEETCRNHFRDERLRQGITCKECGQKTKHYWLESVNKFQCTICRSRTNLKAGTMLHKSKMPIRTWFMIVHFMTTIKKPFSALEMQRQLGTKRYEPIWLMMLKVRHSMGKRDEKYTLKGEIEMDEGFFEAVTLNDDTQTEMINNGELKRGRGSQKQGKVLVMVESRSTNQEKSHDKNRVMGFAKMVIIDNTSSKSINYEVEKGVSKGTVINTDKWQGYSSLNKIGMDHKPEVVKGKDAMKKLPWVHTVIANAKRQFLGVHHSIGMKYLQGYLNEFVYKLNRRNFTYRDNFDGLITAAVATTWF